MPVASRTIRWVITTVSSTHCLKSTRTGRRGAAWLAAWLVVVVFLGWVPHGIAADPHTAAVAQMRLEQADDGIYLTTQVQFELPPSIEEVLDKGIAIYFVAEA